MCKILTGRTSWFVFLSAVAWASALAPVNANAASCAEAPGYPLGRWGTSTRGATPATYSTFVTFTTPSSGTWLPSSGTGSFESSAVPAPGKAVVITYIVEGAAYASENRLVVSADGCRMTGTFSDTQGHRGEVNYKWQGA
jgi:hypothetical protein